MTYLLESYQMGLGWETITFTTDLHGGNLHAPSPGFLRLRWASPLYHGWRPLQPTPSAAFWILHSDSILTPTTAPSPGCSWRDRCDRSPIVAEYYCCDADAFFWFHVPRWRFITYKWSLSEGIHYLFLL